MNCTAVAISAEGTVRLYEVDPSVVLAIMTNDKDWMTVVKFPRLRGHGQDQTKDVDYCCPEVICKMELENKIYKILSGQELVAPAA
jgi:hypothetical protein